MESNFQLEFKVRWNELDANGHLASVHYFNYAYHTRMTYFESYGFPGSEFQRLKLGPIVFKEEASYFKEVKMQQKIDVNFLLDGLSEDGVRFRIVNEMKDKEKNPVAIVKSDVAWFDLEKRKICNPPEALKKIITQMEKTDTFKPIIRKTKPSNQ